MVLATKFGEVRFLLLTSHSVEFTVRYRRFAHFRVSKKSVATSSVKIFATLDGLTLHTRKVTLRNFDNEEALCGKTR